MNNKSTPDMDNDLEVIDIIKPSNEWTIWRQNQLKRCGTHDMQADKHGEFVYKVMEFKLFDIIFNCYFTIVVVLLVDIGYYVV